MNETKLAKALAFALAGTVLSAGGISSASAQTMYNTFNAHAAFTPTDAGSNATDGWTWSDASGKGTSEGATVNPWVGTPDGGRPFGSVGYMTNWAAQLHTAGESLEISQADAFANYGIYADIDTAKGAWNDKGPAGPTSGFTSRGWGHNTDLGLFKSDVTQSITLAASALSAASGGWNNFGITVFTGMDTNTDTPDPETNEIGYKHHGLWNPDFRPASHAFPNTAPATLDNPLNTIGLTYLVFSDNGTVTFTATAGQIYSIMLGGYSGEGIFGPHDGYKVNITSAPVPIPAAAWLFGSALTGFGVFARRNRSPA